MAAGVDGVVSLTAFDGSTRLTEAFDRQAEKAAERGAAEYAGSGSSMSARASLDMLSGIG